MIYFVLGTQNPLIRQRVKKLIKASITTIDDFSYSKIDLNNSSMNDVIDACSTLPLFGNKKVVEVASFNINKIKKEDQNILLGYLKKPNKSTDLIIPLFIEIENKDKNEFYKKLCEIKEISWEVTEEINPKDWNSAIKKLAIKRNLDFESDKVFEEFINRCGQDLGYVINNLDKLSLLEEEITMEMVQALVAKPLDDSVFDLVDKFLYGKYNEALEKFNELLLQGVDAVTIITVMSQQFRFLYQVKYLSNNGYNNDAIAKELHTSSGRIYYSIKKAASIPLKSLISYNNQLSKIDFDIKSGKSNPNQLIELFLIGYKGK